MRNFQVCYNELMDKNINIEFRIAKKEDVKDIIALTNECFEEETPLDFAEWIFGESENDPNQIYLNGYIDEKLVAHTKITIIPIILSTKGLVMKMRRRTSCFLTKITI